MDVADFDFELPAAQIAQEPAARRGDSRLLVLRRRGGAREHTTFQALPDLLQPGDLLVLNDTRVYPARLIGYRVPSGGAVECLLLARVSDDTWEALVHPGQKLKPGARVSFGEGAGLLEGEILGRRFFGRRTIRLTAPAGRAVDDVIDAIGHIPLPPYIHRDDRPSDRERYQTVYARHRGSVAAPTAGLHFTKPILTALAERGVERVDVTLHVGYGTFKPVRSERVEDHEVDAEHIEVGGAAASALTRALQEGRRIVAVGTTTVRALESLEIRDGVVQPFSGPTGLFIRPGHGFRLVGGLVTNFHLPRSSLLMLVSAFAGREEVLATYREAVALGYRFYSYGDAMLVL
ncbi:MAG: tRNA preQ1(34) S-adenosylmethionine ribosyltransferase-isomerase QueA [Acidimicrobiia bacterium]|nr:tRNA preQ1(34) S-adenosylmethionine ribosyltransferase-isomerase QueA [Acidimicrobiia bacterium]